jgi:hypothetical protein
MNTGRVVVNRFTSDDESLKSPPILSLSPGHTQPPSAFPGCLCAGSGIQRYIDACWAYCDTLRHVETYCLALTEMR